MIGNSIETATYLLTFDIDLTDTSPNCITGTKEFVKRVLKNIPFCEDDDEFNLIMEDILFSSILTVLSFIEKKRIDLQIPWYDEVYYNEFKSFYQRLAVAETKIKPSSDNQMDILSVIASVERKIDRMIEVSLMGTNKKLLEIMYVNSEIVIEDLKSHLYLVLKIQTE